MQLIVNNLIHKIHIGENRQAMIDSMSRGRDALRKFINHHPQSLAEMPPYVLDAYDYPTVWNGSRTLFWDVLHFYCTTDWRSEYSELLHDVEMWDVACILFIIERVLSSASPSDVRLLRSLFAPVASIS